MADYTGGNRFSEYTDQNHSATVWICALLTLTYTIFVFIVRCLLKRKQYSLDDLFVALATLTAAGSVAAIMVALANRFGQVQQSVPPALLSRSSRAFFVSQILFIVSCTFAKLGTICLMMRLFSITGPQASSGEKRYLQWWLCLFLYALTTIWGFLSSIGLGINCPATLFVLQEYRDSCPNQSARWRYITGFDIATEAMIMILGVVIVVPVQLAAKNKIQVLLAFSLRLPIIALSVLHLHSIESYLGDTFPGLALVTVALFQLTQMCWSVVSATIPTLKAFVQSFYTAFGSFTVGPISSAILDSNDSRRRSLLIPATDRNRLDQLWISSTSNQQRSTAGQYPPIDMAGGIGADGGDGDGATEDVAIDSTLYDKGHVQSQPQGDIELLVFRPQTQEFVQNNPSADDEIRVIPPDIAPALIRPSGVTVLE